MSKEIILNFEINIIPDILKILEKLSFELTNLIKEKNEYIINNIDNLEIEEFEYKIHFNIIYAFVNDYEFFRNYGYNDFLELIKNDFLLYWRKLNLPIC